MRFLGRCILALLMMAPAAQAEGWNYDEMARGLGISEVRAGIMLHDIETSPYSPGLVQWDKVDLSKWQNLNVEVLFNLPDADLVRWLGSPRIGLSGSLNFVGKESYARLSAVWHIPVFETGVFFEPMLGGTVHNGYIDNAPAGGRNLGCRFLFQYGFNLGYDISQSLSAMFTVEHSSHLWMCGEQTNDGVNRAGFRLGWKLD